MGTDPDKRTCRARLQARLGAALAAGRARLRAERGSVLIEVMVGAVVLSIATVAILNGIDGAESAGAKNKARSVQASLAQADIERMRSLPLSQLDNLRQTHPPINVGGVDYTVVSRTDWVSDKLGVINCSATNAQAEYLKLTSTVTSNATGSTPQTETGLLTPGTGQLSSTNGTATVQLSDRDGNAASGVTVSLSGASTQSATTNSLGCAVFGYIPAGSYTIRVNGYVTIDSEPAEDAITVYPGRASYNAMQVAAAAKVRASFVQPIGQSASFATSMLWNTITVKNANLPGSTKTFVRTAGAAATVDGSPLYPYLDGVGVYAGECAANDPSTYDSDYFAPTATRGFTMLDPGDNPRTVSVEMPTLRVNVTRQTVSSAVPAWFRTQVRVTSLDSGCVSPVYELQPADRSTSSNATVVFNLAMPFGRYRVCASTRGRTSGTSGTTGNTTIERRYTTTATAGSSPTNPADQALTTVPSPANKQITITTPSASTTLSNGMCY